jgi:hypothetical protein
MEINQLIHMIATKFFNITDIYTFHYNLLYHFKNKLN